ncbi:hypothetical protein BN136_3815 [Cronobacter universalis NCTC 9529]|nr:hypothetical protein BN136_3815 [Cronobacter universalis NCTC 9529]
MINCFYFRLCCFREGVLATFAAGGKQSGARGSGHVRFSFIYQ